jgi:flagellar FliL protein
MASAAKATAKEAEPEEQDPEAAGEASEQTSKRSLFGFLSLKMMIIAGAGLAVLLGGGVGAYFFLLKPKPAETKTAAAPSKPAVFVDLPEVLVNLSSGGSERTQYLKVKIVLELSDPAMIPQIQPVMPRVIDAFQTYLRELRANDLEGSAGLYRLKEELTRRVNASIAPSRINAVLFKEIVVQ